MPQLVRHIAISPRTWLAIGAFCIGTSFMLGYHLDQRSADREMARKVGRPDEVLVQDFIPDRHMNLLNEVHTLGQTVDGDQVTVNVGSEQTPQWIKVIPIYAVSSEFQPIANAVLQSGRKAPVRPMSRNAAEALRRQRLEIEGIATRALAFAIAEASAQDTAATGSNPFVVLAESGAIRLVDISGALVTGHTLRASVAQALLAEGIASAPDSLMIAPAALSETSQSSEAMLEGLRWWLSFLGVGLVLFAMLAQRLSGGLAGVPKKPTPVQNVEAHGSFPAIGLFQPIASQDELALDEKHMLAEKSAAALIRRRMSRLTGFTSSTFGGVRSPR